MEHFFYGDQYQLGIEDLMSTLDLEEEDIDGLPDDWEIEVEETTLEPMFQLTQERIVEAVHEYCQGRWDDRYSEDAEAQDDDIKDAITNGITIDLDKINAAIPRLYYANGTMTKITKADLKELVAGVPANQQPE